MFRQQFLKNWQEILMPWLYTIGFIVGFIYIVRYHEFLILFLSVSLPMLVVCVWRGSAYQIQKVRPDEAYTRLYASRWFSRGVHLLLICACIFSLAWETYASLFIAKRKYTGDVPMQDTARLIVWFRAAREHVKDKGVAANFTIGPMLHAYAGTGVVMNPQFGLKRIGDATEDYLNAMYHGTEEDLMKYCEEHKARYLVYNKGAIQGMHIYSKRYIANAKEIPGTAPANLMFFQPGNLKWFYELTPPRGLQDVGKTYTLFQVVTRKDRRKANELTMQAVQEAEAYNLVTARELIRQAVELDPLSENAALIFYKLYQYPPDISLRGVELRKEDQPHSASEA